MAEEEEEEGEEEEKEQQRLMARTHHLRCVLCCAVLCCADSIITVRCGWLWFDLPACIVCCVVLCLLYIRVGIEWKRATIAVAMVDRCLDKPTASREAGRRRVLLC